MREIKFRIWYLRDKVMNKAFGFHDLGGDDGGEIYAHNEWPPLNCSEDIIFMQYTGLHDKNGREIYEGDIVLLRAISPTHHNYFEDRIQVGFYQGAFYPFGMMGFNGFKESNYEVIGNIYENPELIEDKK